ncbi:MAG: cytochrome P460 family protein [Leptolyngbya sp. SIO1E4]|nr:cytochrome P460 family protein [Leptolyngbya sp. SIO1E4]
MTRAKWISWLILLGLSVGVAITFTNLTSPHALQSLGDVYQQPVSANYEGSNPHQDPYADAEYDEAPADAGTSTRVAFPADYRQQFVQYATVDCPNSRIVRKMYVNSAALDALQTSDIVPSGTVLVMETHAAQQSNDGRLTPTRLNNVFIREKRDGWRVNEDSGEWRSAWYSPEGSLVSSGQGSCIGCHTMVRDRDYLFTLPALLAAAQTRQLQYQETEFGTSVCR